MPTDAAAWFLIFATPVAVWVAWRDMAAMRIPNGAVGLLVAIFAVVGAATLPLSDYTWRWAHLAVLLCLGIVAHAGGLLGGGDAKFIAGAAPFVAADDAVPVLMLGAVMLVGGFVTHRAARRVPAVRAIVPGWKSWRDARFPMGLPLAGTLIVYLALAAAGG